MSVGVFHVITIQDVHWKSRLMCVIIFNPTVSGGFSNSKHQILALCTADSIYQQVSGDIRGNLAMYYTTQNNFLLKDSCFYLENFSFYKVRPDVITKVSQSHCGSKNTACETHNISTFRCQDSQEFCWSNFPRRKTGDLESMLNSLDRTLAKSSAVPRQIILAKVRPSLFCQQNFPAHEYPWNSSESNLPIFVNF